MNHPSYELIESHRIAELGSDATLLRHKKTGARIALLENDDDNKVFAIGFRTPPEDSTGVAHIIEHSVLCGSKHFPIKDPFLELAKGSLNTFLNAMTYPDKTVYPCASCNDQDFKNLMHVYMDAVLYPRIYDEKSFFLQEGWHYEMNSPEDELTINGIVYNEMKGAFSSPDDVLDRELMRSLFPDNTYSMESGGDPECIPDLTYEQYLEFHRRYYHPSNSYIYLYGKMDMEERLDWMDREYLSHFERLDIRSEVALQKPFSAPAEVKLPFSVIGDEEMKDNTYLSRAWCLGELPDAKMQIAFDVLDYALCSSSGAVLKKALIDEGIGVEVYSSLVADLRQPYYAVIAKGTEEAEQEHFLSVIRRVLETQARDGIEKKALYAGLNQNEFRYREADFGRLPKGLVYGLRMCGTWLYDDNAPWNYIEADKAYAALKEGIENGFFEDLIRTYLLDNPHGSTVTLVPEKNLTEKKEAALRERLAAKKAGMSDEEIRAVIAETQALKVFQETPDTPEALATIPMLTRADMRREAEPVYNTLKEADGIHILQHEIFTNGIAYLSFVFDMEHVPERLYPYLGLLRSFLGMVDTEHYSYADLDNEIDIQTGGMGATTANYPQEKTPEIYTKTFQLFTKVLLPQMAQGFALSLEVLTKSDFSDIKRMRELLEETKSQMQSDLTSSGHMVAAVRAMSHISETAKISDMMSGIDAYSLVCELTDDYNEEKHRALQEKLTELCHLIFRPENLMVDLTAPAEYYEECASLAGTFVKGLFTDKVAEGAFRPALTREKEAFRTAGQVQYVCRAGNYRATKGLQYTGALQVLRQFLATDYLWSEVRVKGGAYGCMCSFTRNGDSYLVSYRDPHLRATMDVFAAAAQYVRQFEADERTLTQLVIGTIGMLDVPKSPNTKGLMGLTAFLTGSTMEVMQKSRDQILDITAEGLRDLAGYIEAMLEDDMLCVVGAAEKIDEAAALFDSVKQLV